jgi:hypothetical protein
MKQSEITALADFCVYQENPIVNHKVKARAIIRKTVSLLEEEK